MNQRINNNNNNTILVHSLFLHLLRLNLLRRLPVVRFFLSFLFFVRSIRVCHLSRKWEKAVASCIQLFKTHAQRNALTQLEANPRKEIFRKSTATKMSSRSHIVQQRRAQSTDDSTKKYIENSLEMNSSQALQEGGFFTANSLHVATWMSAENAYSHSHDHTITRPTLAFIFVHWRSCLIGAPF